MMRISHYILSVPVHTPDAFLWKNFASLKHFAKFHTPRCSMYAQRYGLGKYRSQLFRCSFIPRSNGLQYSYTIFHNDLRWKTMNYTIVRFIHPFHATAAPRSNPSDKCLRKFALLCNSTRHEVLLIQRRYTAIKGNYLHTSDTTVLEVSITRIPGIYILRI